MIQPISDIKPGTTTPLKDVKAQIKSQLTEKDKTAAIQKWADEVKKTFDSKVSYATGFAPPAAATDTSTTTG